MLQHKLLGLVHQIGAGVDLGEAVNTQTIGFVHVLVQKLAACVSDRENFQEVGSAQKTLDVVFVDGDLSRVGVVYQTADHTGFHPVEGDYVLPGLDKTSGEHSFEVRGE